MQSHDNAGERSFARRSDVCFPGLAQTLRDTETLMDSKKREHRHLTAGQRQSICYSFSCGMTIADMARELGCARSTVRRALGKAPPSEERHRQSLRNKRLLQRLIVQARKDHEVDDDVVTLVIDARLAALGYEFACCGCHRRMIGLPLKKPDFHGRCRFCHREFLIVVDPTA